MILYWPTIIMYALCLLTWKHCACTALNEEHPVTPSVEVQAVATWSAAKAVARLEEILARDRLSGEGANAMSQEGGWNQQSGPSLPGGCAAREG